MKKADLLIAHTQGVYNIKVEGRANFECAPPLRNLANNLDKDFTRISIDLTECSGMDSTFMGVLAMLGLHARSGGEIEIINAGSENRHLLEGLGIEELFHFTEKQGESSVKSKDWVKQEGKNSQLDQAETVYSAHDTLVRVHDGNKPKFEKVVEYAKKDLDRLRDTK